MKTLQYLLLVAFLLSINSLWAIQEFDIRFDFKSISCDGRQVCYDTQIRSADGQAWNLADQNFRIFYDASMASYVSGSAKSLLESSQYSDVLITADIQNVDASGFPGDLSFQSTLSFLNYSIVLEALSSGGINLPANGDWVSTSELCFDITQELIDNGSECLGLVWGRSGKTDGIATAFVEVTQWLEANSTSEAIPNIYDDLDADDGNNSCISPFCGGPENENTPVTCSDGIDNDLDGLIDCDDPGCANVDPCKTDPSTYQIALALESVDCTTGLACYNLNLTSGSQSFTLGSQRYQLFYNTAVGSFVSGTSLLGSEFQGLSLQASTPIENVNANGVGDLPYEGDLGFINFTIQLSDDGLGSNVLVTETPTTAAELCFVMTDQAINNSGVCFETTWARIGVTDDYNLSMVEIEEWLGPGASSEVTGTSFGDLNSGSGDDACFNVTCRDNNNESGEVQCQDNLDNDNDGLVDCLDPGCGSSVVCQSQCNAQAPTLSSGN